MKRLLITMLISTVALSGVFASGNKEPFQKLVPNMDIDKFMGPWYVISFLPSFLEKDGVNGIETYSLDAKGNIRVEYILYKGSPDGKKKIMHQKGWIVDKTTNTEWKVQPLWPLKLPYLIIDLADDYRYSVVGTNNYKYVWILAREPVLSEEDYHGILARLEERGYAIEDIQVMPQIWN